MHEELCLVLVLAGLLVAHVVEELNVRDNRIGEGWDIIVRDLVLLTNLLKFSQRLLETRFYGKLKMELGYQFKHPTFRQGFTAEIIRLQQAGLLNLEPATLYLSVEWTVPAMVRD